MKMINGKYMSQTIKDSNKETKSTSAKNKKSFSSVFTKEWIISKSYLIIILLPLILYFQAIFFGFVKLDRKSVV